MNNPHQLPEELYQVRDAVIENIHKGIEPPASLGLIQEWLEGDGWDALVASIGTMAVDLNQLAESTYTDKEFILGWLGEKQTITDDMRITHARMLISQASNGDDGYLVPSVYSFTIKSGDGRSAVIAAIMHMMGQGGPETSWWGAYKTHKEFLDALKKAGLIPIEYIKDLTDAEVLNFWKKD